MSRLTSSLPAIRIEVGNDNSQPYKSIGHIVWDNVPPLAVLTGLNGSGKSQFLEVLAYGLTYPSARIPLPQHRAEIAKAPVTLSGDTITPDEIGYLANPEEGFRSD